MFSKVLVANRGEIACRVIATCRRLGVRTVAVFSEADERAPHVSLADEAFAIGPAPVTESYLKTSAIAEVLERSGADAVHPGYGFLSENPDFSRAVAEAGAVFVGPSPAAMSALGDKVQARKLAQEAGLAPPPGTEEPVATLDDAAQAASRIGYPVIVKAVGGGGGIGMQIAADTGELEKALVQCRARGKSAFMDDRVYVEKYLSPSRHVEVQVLRDRCGGYAFLGERECSVQRRHQKIVEESPSPAAWFHREGAEEKRTWLRQGVQRLLEACDYVGAATVEFVAGSQGELYFLEVNARLQVEHPVTELTHGVDLVEQQLLIAAGEGIPREVIQARSEGHAIEARVCAEDPQKAFLPQPGEVTELSLPVFEGVRVDSGIKRGSIVTPYYDSLLFKVIAHAPTRGEALGRLEHALSQTKLVLMGSKGPRQSNIQFLLEVLGAPAFLDGGYDTGLVASLLSERK